VGWAAQQAAPNKDACHCDFLGLDLGLAGALLVPRALFFVSIGMVLLAAVSYWVLCHYSIHSQGTLNGSIMWELLDSQ
jgi:hypothetical protein